MRFFGRGGQRFCTRPTILTHARRDGELFQLYRRRRARYLEMVPLKPIAGLGFIAIGAWSLLEHFRG